MDRREEAGEIQDNLGEQLEQMSLEWYKILGIVFSHKKVRTATPAKGNIFQRNTSLQWNNIIFTSSGWRDSEMYRKKPQTTLLTRKSCNKAGWQMPYDRTTA